MSLRILSIILSIALLAAAGLTSCGSASGLVRGKDNKQLYHAIDESPVFSRHHTGFALYDPDAGEMLCQYHADKYYTPASNTKILTLLTSLHVLGDSVETFRYGISGDSLLFQGMADPSFLFSKVPSSGAPFRLLEGAPGDLYYLVRPPVKRFGPGWAWDDYPYAYQVERSTFPIYGNRVSAMLLHDRTVKISPGYFSDFVREDLTIHRPVTRDAEANAFALNPRRMTSKDTIDVPFIVSDYEVAQLLEDTLKRPVRVLYDQEERKVPYVQYGSARDTLLKHMMQVSDNFIAEQLLMQCAFYMRGTFESDSAIAVAKEMIFGGSPDPLQWVDGSGLSRYNLFTPRSVVWILDQVRELTSMDYITEVFPAGGYSGTLEKWYHHSPPYVYAKTGTLRNQHCLSGYIKTDSGRWLIFSFMHNHFTGESSEVKREMERILRQIKTAY